MQQDADSNQQPANSITKEMIREIELNQRSGFLDGGSSTNNYTYIDEDGVSI